jgi:hypothetical protein
MASTRSLTTQRLGAIAVGAWFAGSLLLGAGLLARHVVALPAPASTPLLGASLASLRSPRDGGRWMAVHVLYAECRCSLRIVEHLVQTERPAGWSEIVLWVGVSPPEDTLAQHGFDVRRITREVLSSYGIEAAPLLVALDPADHVRYSGGYTDRKQGPVIDDLRLLAEARGDGSIAALPVFGCAVSDRLQQGLAALPTL